MKKMLLTLAAVLLCAGLSAQYRPAVSVLGDSYSTFEGFMTPSTNEVWYYALPGDNTDVRSVTHTWWHQVITSQGYRLCVNNSYSGSTIGYHGYNNNDYSPRSFLTRMTDLGCPDIIFIFGGTNDSWAGEQVGEYKYDGFTHADYYCFRPAMARMLSHMKERYPGVDIYFILNTDLRPDITESAATICRHYGVPLIALKDIDKQAGHPTIKGHAQIARQVIEAMKKK